MTRLLLRSLRYYWRTNAAVVAGVAIAVSVLAGALLVGQSVRASLRDIVMARIGRTDYVVSADRFFAESLAQGLSGAAEPGRRPATCPMITLKGVVQREGTSRQAYDAAVYGVDERFWAFHGFDAPGGIHERGAILGASLAAQLAAKAGDGLLLRLGGVEDIPAETLFGRRDNATKTIRLTCRGIAGPERLGEFELRPGQGQVLSVFVSLRWLQRQLAQPGRVNTVLLAAASSGDDTGRFRAALREHLAVADVGVRVRPLRAGRGVSIESSRVLLDDGIARAALDAATETSGSSASGVFAYLANTIRVKGREIPYSVIAAADLGRGALQGATLEAGTEMRGASDAARSIWLTEWAARDLGAAVGDAVEIEYYLWQDRGGLTTGRASFTLAGIVSASGDVDDQLAPDVPGITDARKLHDWDPPFPLDLGRIRPQDETYWERYRGTPKAFVTLATGQALWGSRYGRLTAVRVAGADQSLAARLTGRIDPTQAGFTVAASRREGIDASRGAVDLGEYFLYFSAFLIVAAVLLVASFFRLGVEQRVRELGALAAMGFSASTLRWMFLAEGAILLAIGSLLGILGALAWGGVLLSGLRTWWVGAVGTDRVSLHVSWTALGAGVAVGAAASLAAIAWTVRAFTRRSARMLLSGELESRAAGIRRARLLGAVVAVAPVGAAALLGASAMGSIASVEGFFGAGALLLVSTVSLAAALLRRAHPRPVSGQGWRAFIRLAVRGAAHRPTRSLLPVILIASATFVIVSVDAFRKGDQDEWDRRSGTGGYALVATSALPVLSNPESASGREALGIDASESPVLADAKFVSFRERPGDDASCLNLYAPRVPTILGASRAFLAEGRFSFGAVLARTSADAENPWLLLDRDSPDDVVPAIADANSLEYSLHLRVGDEIRVTGSHGAPVRLRIVAALKDSVLQGALIVSEANFLRDFPAEQGYRFFLVDVPRARVSAAVPPLTERLAESGMRVESSRERLGRYHRVENTYLSTFQALGALGLVLGTLGLLAVFLRNVLERRAELALLRAVGYRQGTLAAMIAAEHLVLLAAGLACGTLSALVAIAPALWTRGGAVPFATTGLLLTTVSAAGLLASLAGSVAVLRSPLVAALRSE